MFGLKKKKKKKIQPERIDSLTANGVPVNVINFALIKNKDGSPRLEVRTPDACEALHYDEVDFVLESKIKKINVKGKFKEASNEKKFKLYIFDIEDYKQYYK